MTDMNTRPDRLLRLPQILDIVPIGRSTLWAYVSDGRFPEPIRLSSRCTVWRESDIRDWLDNLKTES